MRAGAARYLAREFEHVDEQLGRGPYLLAETFSAADLYLHMVTRWCRRLERKAWRLTGEGARVLRSLEQVEELMRDFGLPL